MRLVHNGEKQSFSFKKCSAFQFVKRKVRRWMRNPKVNVEKVQTKGYLSPCPKCQEGQNLWYTHFPAPYGYCHYSPGGYYLPHPPSPLCQPCAPCTPCQSDKNKTCKARKWKMLSRHHGDNNVKEAETETHVICPWTMSPMLGSPVLLECCICNGPFITYGNEEAWQPRQRTQAMDLYYHGDLESDYSCPSDTTFMKQRKMGLNDFIQKLSTNNYACKHSEVQSILNLTPPQDAELMNSNPSPPPSPSQQINLGPSSNPTAKPSDFDFLKVIGKGSFGKVLLARHRNDEQSYAVKVLQKKAILKKKEEKHIMSERNVLLKNVKHPFLVGLHYSFQTADKLYFVLDYINGGELFYHLQRERCFLEPRARFYAAEIASALGYLHSLNIVYRDLKPENILLDSQGHIILTDFGLCKENIEPNGTTSTFCGTPEYLAPEVLHKQPYDRTVDWWCLGAVLYEMLYGLPPFYSRNTAEMYDNILNKPLQLKPNISNAARHLLEGLLQKDRTKRLGFTDDFNEIKNHMFFSPINWDDLNAKKLTPPFNPNVTGPNDLRHFDPEFTDEPVPSSIGCSPDSALVTASITDAAEAFLGFSYAPAMDSYL
ncbi:serine/threonine-protein kinase Sgk1-like isoform X2 [Myxocyprinus asiaticus]|uniref:serine/threonine-protein kinase Sgk1-like isoform X2 n=1 Tax=Myxocyprinus asiaticus TaxID=70543 RepID=UPI0022229653|nr:serine/threonine-protein kinase Sgk1-like isoform X2 [Myxocyprinus asiaticus]